MGAGRSFAFVLSLAVGATLLVTGTAKGLDTKVTEVEGTGAVNFHITDAQPMEFVEFYFTEHKVDSIEATDGAQCNQENVHPDPNPWVCGFQFPFTVTTFDVTIHTTPKFCAPAKIKVIDYIDATNTFHTTEASAPNCADVESISIEGQPLVKDEPGTGPVAASPTEITDKAPCAPVQAAYLDCDADGKSDRVWPMLVQAGSEVVVREARFKVDKDSHVDGLKVRGTDDGNGFTFEGELTQSNDSDVATVTNLTSGTWPQRIARSDLNIKWTTKIADKEVDLGTSHIPVFVTMGGPGSLSKPYVSIVDIAISAANGATDAGTAFGRIWDKFKARSLHRRTLNVTDGSITEDGAALKYWYDAWSPVQLIKDTEQAGAYCPTSTDDAVLKLLSTTDHVATCGEWAVFFQAALEMAGVFGAHGAYVHTLSGFDKAVPPATLKDGETQFMLVHPWIISGTVDQSKDKEYSYANLYDANTKEQVGENQLSYVDQGGGVGQGHTSRPKGMFRRDDHIVVLYNGIVFDPSYGTGPFADGYDWAMASLDGYAIVSPAKKPNAGCKAPGSGNEPAGRSKHGHKKEKHKGSLKGCIIFKAHRGIGQL